MWRGKPSGRVNFMLRVDKKLLSKLRKIAEFHSIAIADLVEAKILELIREFKSDPQSERSESHMRKGESHIRKNIPYEISNKDKTPQASKRKPSNSKNREFSDGLCKASNSNKKWTRRDLNPGPPPRKGGALPLSYEPS